MRWVALLRAVNLGARNRVPMAELRTLLERQGFGPVRTYIASGNVVLDADEDGAAVARELERLIADSFSVETTVIMRTSEELAAVVASHPFGADGSHTHVSFLAAAPDPEAVARLTEADHGPDGVHVTHRDVYLHYPHGFRGARLSAAKLEQLLGVPGTLRNWRTVTALAKLASTT